MSTVLHTWECKGLWYKDGRFICGLTDTRKYKTERAAKMAEHDLNAHQWPDGLELRWTAQPVVQGEALAI